MPSKNDTVVVVGVRTAQDGSRYGWSMGLGVGQLKYPTDNGKSEGKECSMNDRAEPEG